MIRPNKLNHINPLPHTTILQQTTSNIFCQKIENLYNWIDNLWLKVENIVSKEEIVRFEQFLLLSLCFQKAVCCRAEASESVYMRERVNNSKDMASWTIPIFVISYCLYTINPSSTNTLLIVYLSFVICHAMFCLIMLYD